VVRTAASQGDAKLFDALMAAADRAAVPEDHDRYLNALTEFRDPALIDRALQHTLSPTLRSQDSSIYVASFFGNPVARLRAWSFVKERWAALEPKIAIFGGDTRLVAALGQFCDAQMRDDIVSFFSAHKLPGAARTLDQTIERINNCVELKEKQTPAVTEWIATR
jgi:aminopeptidase N